MAKIDEKLRKVQRKLERQAKYDDAINKKRLERMSAPTYEGMTFSGDESIASGQQIGLDTAKTLYGTTAAELGREAKDIAARRKAALDGNDPATQRLRQGRNSQIRAARSAGATAGQEAQIHRQAAQDIRQQEFKSQQEALGEYQDLIGNMIGGTTSLQSGYAGLTKSGEKVADDDGGSTVICTELHRQGYMSDEMLEKDREYGAAIRSDNGSVYVGYIILAMPIVRLMKKSKLFTKLISIPAMAWARDMAYDNSFIGKCINKTGQPVCRIVGKVAVWLHQKGLIYA